MPRDGPRRRGVALLLALVALVVAGTFLVAGFYAARQTEVADRVAVRTAQVDGANDLAAAAVLTTWDSAARFRQAVGFTLFVPAPVFVPAVQSGAWITRVSPTAYLATLRSSDTADSSIARRASWLLRVDAPRWPSAAALIASGDVRALGVLQILPPGPPEWPTCGPVPGGWVPIAVPPGRTAPGPYVQWAPAGADSTFHTFGGVSLQALSQRATVRLLAGSSVQGPFGAVTVAPGDLELTGGSGRGLLVVEGRLRVSGPLFFRGVVVALGGLEVTGPGAFVEGLVLVGGDREPAVLVNVNADLRLRYDPCLADDVAWHAGRATPLASRGWAPAP